MQTRTVKEDKKRSKRTIIAILIILIGIPLTIAAGVFLFDDRSYYVVSLIVVVLALVPFALVFEDRKPQAQELVVLAVLVAIGVVGRAAFFWAPQVKPVVAIVIIAGVCFGAEAGFIVGALIGFVSNFIFGQGPQTPWQMFGFGIIGFLAGVLFKRGMLSKKVVPLCIYGGLSTFFIYGLLLDTQSMLMMTAYPSWQTWVLFLSTGLPFNAVHAVSTVIFLAILARPMVGKLDRIKKKYGLMDP